MSSPYTLADVGEGVRFGKEKCVCRLAIHSTITGDKCEGGLSACRRGIGMEEGRPTNVEKGTRASGTPTSTTTGGECVGGAPRVP